MGRLSKLIGVAIFIVILIAGLQAVSATTYECDSCSDCSSKIQSAISGDIIILNTSLSGIVGSCMEFDGTDNVTFDCDGFTINGDGSGSDYGIYLNDSSDNNTVMDCPNISAFETGIGLFSSDSNNLTNVTASYNTNHGIWLKNTTSYNIIKDSIIENNTGYGIFLNGSGSLQPLYNKFYNNLLNNSINVYSDNNNNQNYWNTTQQSGTRIYSNGNEIGGNFWAFPNGTGYSETCSDSDGDGFCDSSYTPQTNNTDYLPLSENYHVLQIGECATLSNTGGWTYNLTQDIIENSSTCFTVTASSITIDCNGHTIDGASVASSYAITTNGYNSLTVRNCVITDWDDGIYIASSLTNSILNTNVSSCQSRGIHLSSTDSSTIEDVKVSGNNDPGIFLTGSSSNTLNRVNASHGLSHGISLDSSSDSNVINNSIASYNDVNGLAVQSSAGNRIINTDMHTNDGHGVLIHYTSNSNLTDCNVYSNLNQGIRMTYSGNNWVKDTLVNNSGSFEVYADHDSVSNNYFVNTTFNKSDVSVNNDAVIWVRWYMDLRVLDTLSSPVVNASVNVTDVYDSLKLDSETNSSGYVQRIVLSEYNQNSSVKNYYTDYTVNANKTGYASNSTSVNLTGSRLVILYLERILPYVILKTYTNALVESSTFSPGRIVRIRAFGTHSLGRTYLDASSVTITDPSDTDVVSGALMTNISEITDGYLYEYNYTLPGDGNGTWAISVTLTDINSNQDYDSTKIAVSSLSIQVRLILNNTGARIYIPSSGVGEKTFSGLTPAIYSTPDHYYLASYLNNALSSLVLFSGNPVSSFTEKSSATYTLGLDGRFKNSGIFLVFTEGSWRNTERRMSLIEKGEFLSEISPSFAFGLGNSYPLKIVLDYDTIDINSSSVVGRGYSRIVIENKGRYGGKTSLDLKRI